MNTRKKSSICWIQQGSCTHEFTVIAIAWIRPEEAKAKQNPHHGEGR